MSIKIPHPLQKQPLGVFGEAFHVPLQFQNWAYFAYLPYSLLEKKPQKPKQTRCCLGSGCILTLKGMQISKEMDFDVLIATVRITTINFN